jgi:hypothetical protein
MVRAFSWPQRLVTRFVSASPTTRGLYQLDLLRQAAGATSKLVMIVSDVGPDERPVVHHALTGDEEILHATRRPEDESRDGVSDVFDVVGWPHGDIARGAHFQSPQIRPTKTSGPP